MLGDLKQSLTKQRGTKKNTSQNRKFKLRHSAFWGTAATDDVKEAMRL